MFFEYILYVKINKLKNLENFTSNFTCFVLTNRDIVGLVLILTP